LQELRARGQRAERGAQNRAPLAGFHGQERQARDDRLDPVHAGRAEGFAEVAGIGAHHPRAGAPLLDDSAQRGLAFDHEEVVRRHPGLEQRARDAAGPATELDHGARRGVIDGGRHGGRQHPSAGHHGTQVQGPAQPQQKESQVGQGRRPAREIVAHELNSQGRCTVHAGTIAAKRPTRALRARRAFRGLANRLERRPSGARVKAARAPIPRANLLVPWPRVGQGRANP